MRAAAPSPSLPPPLPLPIGQFVQCASTISLLVEYLPAAESQEMLGIGDDSNLKVPPPNPPPADKLGAGPSTTIEEIKLAPDVTNLRITTRGRVQTKDSTGDGWSHLRTPVATAGQAYATVRYKGGLVPVHDLVWETFNGPIPEGMTIDHMIPSRKSDNRLSAIRPATPREQNINRDLKPISERSNSTKTAVRGRPVNGGDDTWILFESQHDAERELHALFPEKKFDNSNIGRSAHAASEGKKRKVVCGWGFEFTDTCLSEPAGSSPMGDNPLASTFLPLDAPDVRHLNIRHTRRLQSHAAVKSNAGRVDLQTHR